MRDGLSRLHNVFLDCFDKLRGELSFMPEFAHSGKVSHEELTPSLANAFLKQFRFRIKISRH